MNMIPPSQNNQQREQIIQNQEAIEQQEEYLDQQKEAIEQQEQNYPAMPPRIKDKGVIEYQLNSDSTISNLIENLSGGHWGENNEGKKVWIETCKRKINKAGLESMMMLVNSTTGKAAGLAQSDGEQIKLILKDGCGTIIRTIHSQHKEFEIDLINKDFIRGAIENIMELSISRSINGVTSRLINSNVNVHENNIGNRPVVQQNKGFFGLGGGN